MYGLSKFKYRHGTQINVFYRRYICSCSNKFTAIFEIRPIRSNEFNEHHQVYCQRLLGETLQERCIINQREMNTRSTFVRKGFYSILGIIEKVQEKQANTTALQKTSFSRRVMREPGEKFG